MLAVEQLNEMRGVDIRMVDKETLTDMSGFPFNNGLPSRERVKRFFETAKNPYCFRYEDMAVKIEFADSGPTLRDVLTALLLRQKNGI